MLLGTAGGEDWYLILLLSLYFNPSVLWTPPLYFAMQNTEEEGEMYFPFASAPILCAAPRNATGHGKGRGLKMGFLCFNSLALLGISLYIVKEILGEWG